MPRKRPDETEAFGSDSFLDVICNVVGILILLVMVVGLRVKHAPLEAAAVTAEASAQGDVSAEQASAEALLKEAQQQQAALAEVDAQQQGLALQLAAAQQQAREEQEKSRRRREQLSQSQQWLADAQAALRGKQQQLQSLLLELQNVKMQPASVVKIENFPAPVSQAVTGDEAHFQLSGGRIVHVPFKPLIEKFRSDARARVNAAPGSNRIEATVGPIGNFTLRYALKQGGYGRFGLDRFSFVPESSRLGETLSEALAASSQFRQVLASYDPNTTTITVWVYPDGFGDFRVLRKEIYTLGYSVAARPLPFGQLISGSPDGSRSSAQ
jgi:multidrug efflux pump subunit AcrA (membrane-fusion protein)